MLKKAINKIKNSGLLKLGAFNSLSIVVKIIAGIVSSKALAFFVGPSGLAFVGIFKDFSTMIGNMASLGTQKGLVKYAAKLKSEPSELKVFMDSSRTLLLVISFALGIFLFAFSQPISILLSTNYDFNLIVKISAFIVPISAFNVYFISVLNGLQYTNHIIRINMLLYVINMIAIVIMSYLMGTFGALLALAVFFILQLFSIIVFKPKHLSLDIFSKINLSSKYTKKLMGYTIMTLFSMFLLPAISIWIRGAIIKDVGEEAAGFWEAMRSISNNYLLFASSLVMLFVLPKLSEKETAFREVVTSFFKTILPLFAIGLLLVFILREYIILLFFNREFIPMESLVKWYVLGDFFRIICMVLATNFFARRFVIGFLITDFLLAVVRYSATVILLDRFGLDGCAMAYLVSYVFYFLLLLFVFRKSLFYANA